MTATVSRDQWGARGPKAGMAGRHPDDITSVVFHYADLSARSWMVSDEEAAVRAIQTYHMDHNGWCDIGYNAIIGMSGTVYVGRDNSFVPAHCLDFNKPSVGVCFLTDGGASINAAAAAVDLIKATSYILGRKLDIFGHREKLQTYCPGDQIMDWVTKVRAPGAPLG